MFDSQLHAIIRDRIARSGYSRPNPGRQEPESRVRAVRSRLRKAIVDSWNAFCELGG